MGSSELVSPSVLAEMKAELESLSKTEPGAREFSEVISELMPLIRGCRDRGHSWVKISESLKKFHSGISVSKLKKYAYEIDPSLKSNAKSSGKSLIPEMTDESSGKSLIPEMTDESSKKSSSKKNSAVNF